MTRSQIDMLGGLADNRARRLGGEDGQHPSWHLWKQSEVNAVIAALAARRPLLVRGEPGTGKSQLARAAAAALGWKLHCHTLHARSEAQDLLYQFDAVRRLADAQVKQLDGDERSYWQPQALWKALDWNSARRYGAMPALHGADDAPPAGHVVLIDEIDKAPSDVPNGLLEVLGARSFEIHGIPLRVPTNVPTTAPPNAASRNQAWPLVIITTNEERELPAAFLRRCMVLTHGTASEREYAQFLVKHGQAHFGPDRGAAEAVIPEAILIMAAQQLVRDRTNAHAEQQFAPGLAEYLDLLYALHDIAPGDGAAQKDWLDKLNPYAFLKHNIGAEGLPQLRQDQVIDAEGRRALGALGATSP